MRRKIKNIGLKFEFSESCQPKICFLNAYVDDWYRNRHSFDRDSSTPHVLYVQIIPFIVFLVRWDTVLQLPKKADDILADELLLGRKDDTFDCIPWSS